MHMTVHDNINAILVEERFVLSSEYLPFFVVGVTCAIHWHAVLNHQTWSAGAVDSRQIVGEPLELQRVRPSVQACEVGGAVRA